MSESAISQPSWKDVPRWYLWDGGFMMIGRSDSLVPAHAHHAIQIALGLDGVVGISVRGEEWRFARGVIVPPDVEHRYDPNGSRGAILFVDPESLEGAWLRATIGDALTLIPEARLEAVAREIVKHLERPLESMEIGALIRHIVASMCAGAPPSRRLDERVTRVLQSMRTSEDLRVSLEKAAETVALSPSRLQHLFKHQVGLPFRRYVLWRKLTRAIVAIGREPTLTAAAQAGDFADAAHLTRTFQQMFGLPPSVLMRGEFFVIPSPYDV